MLPSHSPKRLRGPSRAESPDEDDDGSPWDDQEEDEEGEEADSFVAWEERLVCVMRDGRLVAVTPDAVVGALEGALVESGRLPLAVTA